VFVRDNSKVGFFGEVLPDEPVGIFVQTSLPGMIGQKSAFNAVLMSGEFLVVVRSEGKKPLEMLS